jgi:hypothetical protein
MAGQFFGQGGEFVGAAGDQHHVVSAAGEFAREFRADTR